MEHPANAVPALAPPRAARPRAGAPLRRRPPQHGRHRSRRPRPLRWLGPALAGLAVCASAATGVVVATGARDAAYASVTVRAGDTLSAIAARFHTTVAALAAANRITDPNRIAIGATLQVPSSAPPAAAPPAAAPATVPGATVTVRPGDTLSSIAGRNHTTVAALVATNHITNPNLVFAGAHLALPVPPLPPGWGPGGPLPPALLAHPERLALRPAFLTAASASALAPSLLEAMCWWESGWQSTATSSTGAVGLCQLEPSTVAYTRTALLHDPALDPRAASDNITMAAAYLHDLLVRAGGDPHLALAGYYQGLTSVEKAGMMPSTKTYVTGILNYAALFAAAG